MYYLRCVAEPADGTQNSPAGGLCWADVGSLDEARTAAEAMAADGGWTITGIEQAGEATIEEFGPEGQGFFRRAEEWGVYMVMYTCPAEAAAWHSEAKPPSVPST